jgi:hypothetical protein
MKICFDVCMHVCTYMCMYVWLYIYIYIYIYIHTYIYIYICIYMNTHTHTHTHTSTPLLYVICTQVLLKQAQEEKKLWANSWHGAIKNRRKTHSPRGGKRPVWKLESLGLSCTGYEVRQKKNKKNKAGTSWLGALYMCRFSRGERVRRQNTTTRGFTVFKGVIWAWRNVMASWVLFASSNSR